MGYGLSNSGQEFHVTFRTTHLYFNLYFISVLSSTLKLSSVNHFSWVGSGLNYKIEFWVRLQIGNGISDILVLNRIRVIRNRSHSRTQIVLS